ncbi:MAG: hypothetical protein JRE72_13180 [Deltaproteobacteria bacterium]|jgi:hypothetical protein|nr:hypothetical protein [Deltaproteobacteria bacterium]
MKIFAAMILLSIPVINVLYAGEADVLKVDVKPAGANACQFSVTVHHDDKGWEHYANKWDVVAPDGTVLATRTLHHPLSKHYNGRRHKIGSHPI